MLERTNKEVNEPIQLAIYGAQSIALGVCKGIQEFVSFNSLKQALKAENVIRSNTGGYTVKMNYMTSAGVPGRKRMICIDTSQVCSRDGCTKLEFYINID